MNIENYNPYEDFESVFHVSVMRLKGLGDYKLTDVCLDIRSQYTGASDPWDYESLVKTRDMISRRLDNWNYSKEDDMDRAVMQMCIAALGLIENSLEERKEWYGYNDAKQEQE